MAWGNEMVQVAWRRQHGQLLPQYPASERGGCFALPHHARLAGGVPHFALQTDPIKEGGDCLGRVGKRTLGNNGPTE